MKKIHSSAPLRLCAILLSLCFAACSSGPQVTEVGSAVGGAYTNPKTGESYQGQASSYVKLQPKVGADPKQVKVPSVAP